MLKSLALIAVINAAVSFLVCQDSFATEPARESRIFVLNEPSAISAGPDSILTFDKFGKSGILFGTENRVLGARDIVCSPLKPNHLLVAVNNCSLGTDEILEINAAGNVVNVIPGLGGPASGGSALAFDRDGNLYNFTNGTIFKNGVGFAVLPVKESVSALAIDGSGKLYAPSSLGIFRIDPWGVVTLFADASDGLINPAGLAVDSADNLFVANNPPSGPAFILKFDPSGTSTVFAKNISFQPGIGSLSFDKNGTLYVPLAEDNKILVFDSAGNSEIFADETDGLNLPLGIAIGSCPVEEPLLTLINNIVSFVPVTSTFSTTTDTSGCPAGFAGKFSFSASLTNNSNSSLASLMARVKTLTNNNLLQNAEGGPASAGAVLLVPQIGDFADGLLGTGESVDVPFNICINRTPPEPQLGGGGLRFNFLVDVLGKETGNVNNSSARR